MTEHELLADFVATRSPKAFEQLVRANAGLVYAAARRQTDDPAQAEDVTQAVFILLARKCATIRGPLPGWLVSATCYAARNARRLEARRRYHERRAGHMKLDQAADPSQISWEQYAPAVDAAMNRLGRKYRDAVTLRYLRGMSLRETGDTLGISEEAARKRVDRGVLRLRELLSAKTIVPGVAILAGHLATRSSEAAPVKLIDNLVAAAGSAVKGSTAAAIAAKTATSLAKTKLIAAATVLVLFLGISVTSVAMLLNISAPPPVSIAPPAPPPLSPADLLESQTQGTLELMRWEAVLNAQGAAALAKIGRRVDTPSVLYDALLCNGNQLRTLITQERKTGGVRETGGEPYTAFEKDFGGFIDMSHFIAPISLFAQDYADKESVDRIDPDHIVITPNLRSLKVTTMNASDATGRREYTASLLGQASLSAGDALAYLGSFAVGTNREMHHLIVYETYRATPSVEDNFFIRDTAWWCRYGPAGQRRWGDIAQVWKASIAARPFSAGEIWRQSFNVPAPFEQKTSDGKFVRLVSICRPGQWLSCWWTGSGNPGVGDDAWLSYRLQSEKDLSRPPAGLWAMIQVIGPAAEAKLWTPTGRLAGDLGDDNAFRNVECVGLNDSPTGTDVGVMVGPWKEVVRLQPGETRIVGGVTYQLSKPYGNSQTAQYDLERNGVVDGQEIVTAVTKTGEEIEAFGNPPQISIVGRDLQPIDSHQQLIFSDLPLANISYLRIMRRERQWIRFAGYALNPCRPPREDLTASEVAQANQIVARREHPATQPVTQAITR